jgi:hypothetical protein
VGSLSSLLSPLFASTNNNTFHSIQQLDTYILPKTTELETSNKIYSIADFSINHKLSILLNKLKVLLQSEVPQEGQESVQTAINKIKEKKCKNIPTTFDISNPTYPIQTNTLQDAFLKFIFADPTSGAPQAAETRSGEPQLSGYQLDSKGRIICASAVIIPIEKEMPIWTNVGTLCPAIQNEWTDFLSKVSAHEQQHVNFIQTGFADYGDKIIGKTLLQAKAIYDKMAKQVQKDHDSIDPPSIPLNLALDDTPECKQCPPGQTKCNGECIDLSNPISCGTSCDDLKQCQTPVGGTAACNNGECSGICPAGQEVFNGKCEDKCPEGYGFDPVREVCRPCSSTEPDVCSNRCTNLDSDIKNCGLCGTECAVGMFCKPDPVLPFSTCQFAPQCYYEGHPRLTSCGLHDCCITDPFFGIVCAINSGMPDQRFCFCGPNGLGACSVSPPG